MASLEQQFHKAVEKFQAGQFRPAEKILLKINKRQAGIPDVLHILGLIGLETDRPKIAVKYFSQAVKGTPGNSALLNLLGCAHHQDGDVESAIDVLSRAVALEPELANARFNLANALHDGGRLEEAAGEYKRLVALTPGDASAHNGLGQVLWDLGEREAAYKAYSAAIECDPANAESHFNMGSALANDDRLEDAREHLSQAVKIKPEMPAAVICLADVLRRMGDPGEAVPLVLQALNKDPENHGLHRILAILYQELGQTGKALASVEAARKLKPGSTETLLAMSGMLEKANKLEQAEEIVRDGLKIAPGDIGLNISAARISYRSGDPDRALGILLPLGADDGVSAELRRDRHYLLGQIHDRLGDAGKAYENFTRGNELAAQFWQSPQSEKNVMTDYVDRHLEVATRQWFSTWSAPVDTSKDERSPVFMVGFPRSGTTLADQILDSHPDIQVLEEEPMMQKVRARLMGRGPAYPELLAGLSPDDIAQLRSLYFETADQNLERKEGRLLIDKMPLNLVEAALIHRLFPDARFILMLRHPCDACLSCFMQFFEMNAGMSNFLTLEDTADLYQSVMRLWRRYASLLPLQVFSMRYEDLVDDLEGTTRGLIGFLDLPWDEAVLDFHRHAATRNIKTPSYAQVTQKIYSRSRYRWLRYEKQLKPVLGQLQPFIDEFGYSDPK